MTVCFEVEKMESIQPITQMDERLEECKDMQTLEPRKRSRVDHPNQSRQHNSRSNEYPEQFLIHTELNHDPLLTNIPRGTSSVSKRKNK